jgi:hypothetical protein
LELGALQIAGTVLSSGDRFQHSGTNRERERERERD